MAHSLLDAGNGAHGPSVVAGGGEHAHAVTPERGWYRLAKPEVIDVRTLFPIGGPTAVVSIEGRAVVAAGPVRGLIGSGVLRFVARPSKIRR
jgi:hypothetical protein